VSSDLEGRRFLLDEAVDLLNQHGYLASAQVLRELLNAVESHQRTNRGAMTISSQRLYRAAGLTGDVRRETA